MENSRGKEGRAVDKPDRSDPASHAAFVGRLRILIKRAGNIVSLAQKVRVSDTSIHLWLRGSEPSREKLARLADEMNVSLEWLIRGRGEMSADLIPQGYSVVRRLVNDPKHSSLEGVDYLALKTDWIGSLPGSPSPNDLLLTEMAGDAMSPTIDRGDLVLINGSDRAARDGIFGIVPEWQTTMVNVRRIRDRSDGTFVLLYDNKSYPSGPAADDPIFRLDANNPSIAIESGQVFFVILGRVIWSGGLI
ncbi:MAG TPA: S24 family peptidase [Chloroflexota bacterium]|nr:S24 family peptidase [Chloroflexota bacterium]